MRLPLEVGRTALVLRNIFHLFQEWCSKYKRLDKSYEPHGVEGVRLMGRTTRCVLNIACDSLTLLPLFPGETPTRWEVQVLRTTSLSSTAGLLVHVDKRNLHVDCTYNFLISMQQSSRSLKDSMHGQPIISRPAALRNTLRDYVTELIIALFKSKYS